jgi:peptide/nickel transport system permease protein
MNKILGIVLQRMTYGLMTIIAISMIIFLGVEALPGDVATAILGMDATPEAIAEIRKELHIDLPIYERYWSWLSNFVRGDLGISYASGQSVNELISWRFRNTMFLALSAAIIAVPLAITFGILSALFRNSWIDRSISFVSLVAVSAPEFLGAYILISIFSVHLEWLPALATVTAKMPIGERIVHVLLPSIALTMVIAAHMLRQTRAAIINVLSSPYIEMARLKGLSPFRIILVHAFPNVLAPVIHVIVLEIAHLIVGAVVIEVVFAYPGLGQLFVDAVATRDIPIVQACGFIFGITYILLNLTADMFSTLANPRLRYSA